MKFESITVHVSLPEHGLVLSEYYVTNPSGARSGQNAVAGLLGTPRLLRRSEGHERPSTANVAPGLYEDILNLAIFAELRTQSAVRDIRRQRAHEHLRRHGVGAGPSLAGA